MLEILTLVILMSMLEPKSKYPLMYTGDGFELGLSVLPCSLGQADDVDRILKKWDFGSLANDWSGFMIGGPGLVALKLQKVSISELTQGPKFDMNDPRRFQVV